MVEMLKIINDSGGFNAIIICGMAVAIYRLWQHTNKQQQQMLDIQEVRVKEAKEVRAELVKFSEGTNKTLTEMSSAITLLKEMIVIRLK